MTENPYEAPTVLEPLNLETPLRVLPQTRWQAARPAMWRGAKLGWITFMVVIVPLVTMGMIAMVLLRPRMLLSKMPMEATLGLVLIPGTAIIYGSLPGAFIMGLIAAVRWRRPSSEVSSERS